jgi:hypothetical protein
MTRQPQSCPICGRLTIKPLLDKFHITADGEGSLHDVKALAAFSCVQEGHIFFVRI